MTKENQKGESKREELVALLEQTAVLMEIAGENDFKVRAYRKGARAIESAAETLSAIAAGEVKIAGVGEGLKTAIGEFLEKGDISEHEKLLAKVPQGVLELMSIPGLGPKKAATIQKELGVNTVGELEYACRENRLTALKGFGPAVQSKILESIEELRANAGKHRLDEALALVAALEGELRSGLKEKSVLRDAIPVGAVGRHVEIVSGIELCVVGDAKKLLACAEKLPSWKGRPKLKDHEPMGEKTLELSGNLKSGTRASLWIVENEPSDKLLRWLLADAEIKKALELKPSEFRDWQPSWIESSWISSERRPKSTTYRRGRDGGVKGVFHCHTNFSDGTGTLEDMVRGAEARGFEYIGISDHSQSAIYAQGLKIERLKLQREMIRELQKKVSIRIFHGVESDILADGALDYDERTLASFDFIVGSVHNRFKMEEAAMTERLVRALENPYITIWGHPTGRLLLGRKPYLLDWERCLKAAAKNGVAVEFNANPQRLDVDWRLGGLLEKHGSQVCINPDAHSVDGLSDTVYGEYMAEKAMVSRERILNLKSVDEIEKYLWERRKHASA